MRPKPLLACAASVLAASATFAVAGTASAADPAGSTAAQANVSDFLARQLTTLPGSAVIPSLAIFGCVFNRCRATSGVHCRLAEFTKCADVCRLVGCDLR